MGLGRLEICFRWFREVGDLFRRAFGVGGREAGNLFGRILGLDGLERLEVCLGGLL